MNGVIRKLHLDKGYGFIADDETKIEHFFHRSGVIGTAFQDLKEGDRVTFEAEASAKGPRAGHISRI